LMNLMETLRRVFASSDDSRRGPEDDYWYEPVGGSVSSGVNVTSDTAMRMTSVTRAVRFLSEIVASLPLDMFERIDGPLGGDNEKRTGHPLHDLLHFQPNEYQTSFEFREMMQGHVLLRGNAVAEKIPGPRGMVDQLIPIHPNDITFEITPRRTLRYRVRDHIAGGPERVLLQDEVLHVRGFSRDGFVGMNPIREAAESLGIAMATEEHAGRLFSNGATPSGILEHPGELGTQGRKNLMSSWYAAFGGVKNSGKVAVLENGMKWKETQMSSRDAQFIESRQFSVVEIARIFGVPPHILYDLTKSSFSNIETQSLELMKFTIRQWLVRWEQAIQRDLVVAKHRFFAKFNVDGLLRSDTKTRFEAYGSAIDKGWMTRNEARRKEDLSPLEGLDTPLEPLNMSSPRGESPVPDDPGGGENGVANPGDEG